MILFAKNAPDIKFLFMRRFNQDPVENLFGRIRSLNGNAFNPTPIQFYFTFRKVFAMNCCNTASGNCAQDYDDMLTAFKNYVEKNPVTQHKTQEKESILLNNHDYHTMDLTEQNAFQYICGYLMRKCIDQHSCDVCLVYAKQYIDLDSTSYYCFFRAYNSTEDNLYGSLLMPNDEFIEYVKKLEYCFFDNIKKLMVQQKIIQKLISC